MSHHFSLTILQFHPLKKNQQQQQIFKDTNPKGMGMIKLKPLKQEANSNGAKGGYSYVKFTTKEWNVSLDKKRFCGAN